MLSLSVCILRSLCVYYDLCVYTTISVVFLSHHYLKRTKAGKNKGIIRQTIKDEERWSRKQKTVWTNTRIENFSKAYSIWIEIQVPNFFITGTNFLRPLLKANQPTNQPTYLSNYSDWSNFFPMTVNSQLEMWNHIRGGCNKHLNLVLVPSHGEIMFGCLET